MFSMQYISLNPLIATFQLSSAAASLNLGQSQNGVLGNELNSTYFCLDPYPGEKSEEFAYMKN